ncbi:MAG: glycosyltransferase family 2 protein [Bacteroidales bacterium]|nr:glycosyltransferase family 2 protein [Bacteroidales bacterium]
MSRISVVIITLNEERNIKRCLDSVMPIADEVVVVDSYSTDATREICSNYPVKFVEQVWGGYVATKNFANSLATHDWIFSIDADEAVSPELAESILNIKSQDMDSKVFSMNRKMNYCGRWIRHGGWYPDVKIRIFNRQNVSWTGQKVHETLSMPQDTQVVHLKGDLFHYSFYSPEEHRRQQEKFALLSAEEAVGQGKKASYLSAAFHAGWKFLRDYLFKAGFLEGSDGFVISKTNAHGVWYKYMKIREFSRK